MPIPPCVGHHIEERPGDLPPGRLPAGAPPLAAAISSQLVGSPVNVLAPDVLERNLAH
jgi:hypothetical protein